MKRLTKEPWFGSRRFGWGWRPITWQGWSFTLVYSTAMVLAVIWRRQSGSGVAPVFLIAVIALFLLTCYLTGGPPGGPTLFNKRPR